jgi:tRNA A58 N-methylase Trm61
MIEEFKRLTSDLIYKPGAIFPSEMFLFYCEAKACEADHIIESGVGHGGSTRYLARLFPSARITSVDKNEGHPGLTEFRKGDATQLLPEIVKYSHRKNIAILIDGPKKQKAINLAGNLLQDSRVHFVAVHDLPDGDSHTKSWRDNYGFLDANVGEYLKHYPNGPGLMVFR